MKSRLPLKTALAVADAIAAQLAPACVRLQVCGSVRRQKAEVGDIELLAIPRWSQDLLGCPLENLLWNATGALVAEGRLGYSRGGALYKQFHIVKAGCPLDVFTATPEQWGVQLVIRTGPAEFSKRFVTQKCHGGLLPDGWEVSGGQLWDENRALVPTAEEADVFRALGTEYLEPEARS